MNEKYFKIRSGPVFYAWFAQGKAQICLEGRSDLPLFMNYFREPDASSVRPTERESARERKRVCVCVRERVREREGEIAKERVCVRERERGRERERAAP
jgi:hypothetical protein